MTREYINRAIYRVMTTQFKKDAKEEHKIVEDAGYTIYKSDGSFTVRNEETHRELCIDYKGYYSVLYTRARSIRFRRDEGLKFDFVGYLAKPTEDAHDYMTTDGYYKNRSIALQKYERLERAKRYVKYEQQEIESIKQKIERLQNELVRTARNVAKAEAEVKETRVKIGLTKGRCLV